RVVYRSRVCTSYVASAPPQRSCGGSRRSLSEGGRRNSYVVSGLSRAARGETMSPKDKLEIGLKPDAPFRPDNLPDFQQDDPACQTGATPGSAPEVRRARKMCDD